MAFYDYIGLMLVCGVTTLALLDEIYEVRVSEIAMRTAIARLGFKDAGGWLMALEFLQMGRRYESRHTPSLGLPSTPSLGLPSSSSLGLASSSSLGRPSSSCLGIPSWLPFLILPRPARSPPSPPSLVLLDRPT